MFDTCEPLRSAVGRGVVDHDDLVRDRLARVAGDPIETLARELELVQNRNDD